MTPRIWFETHSHTLDNEAGIATGWQAGELSAAGREAALELGRRYSKRGVAAVFCSDLRRAVETAEIAFAGAELPIFHDWRLRECNYGALNGAPRTEIEARRLAHVQIPWPDGESYYEVVHRVESLVKDLSERWLADTVLIIGHSATKWALDVICAHKELETAIAAGLRWQPGWRYGVERRRPRGGFLHFGGRLAQHVDEELSKDFGQL